MAESTPVLEVSEWRALAAPRPAPLPGAQRIALGDVDLLGGPDWRMPVPVAPRLAVSELIATNLLPRSDVTWVERRRFTVAAEAERTGDRAPEAPPAGVSVRPDFVFAVTWSALDATGGQLEMRLTDPATGAVRDAWRVTTSADAGPVALARTVIEGLLTRLSELDLRPPTPRRTGDAEPNGQPVSRAGVEHFLRGLAAEERWRWEEARIGYQAALATDPGFSEARAALERTARLRLGGTLAESD
ncbi:MAG: hypothetical protein WD995_13775 [Gemmatimonadota bacterium]